jgi:hypothetical protein
MILGGVPFYLNLLDRRYSLVQNIDNLFFASGGMLRTEFNELYSALFVNSERYVQIVRALTTKKSGLSRKDIIAITNIQAVRSLKCSTISKNVALSSFIRSLIRLRGTQFADCQIFILCFTSSLWKETISKTKIFGAIISMLLSLMPGRVLLSNWFV